MPNYESHPFLEMLKQFMAWHSPDKFLKKTIGQSTMFITNKKILCHPFRNLDWPFLKFAICTIFDWPFTICRSAILFQRKLVGKILPEFSGGKGGRSCGPNFRGFGWGKNRQDCHFSMLLFTSSHSPCLPPLPISTLLFAARHSPQLYIFLLPDSNKF